MSEPEKAELFREKSLESALSPEPLDDYLHGADPGAWLLAGAIASLLTGAVLWGIFGHTEDLGPLFLLLR